jgi:hypothetical protein
MDPTDELMESMKQAGEDARTQRAADLALKEALPGPDTRQRGAEGGFARRDGSGRRVAAAA